MVGLFQSFDNREIAVCIWMFGFACWFAARKANVRSSIINLVHAVLARQIVVSVLIFATYFVGFVWILSILGVWVESQFKLTLFWFFSVGLVGLASVAEVEDGEPRIWEKAKNNFSISVFLDFFVNLYRMPLFAELLFVPFIAVLSVVVAYSSHDEKYKKIEALRNKLIISIGFIFLICTVREMIGNYEDIVTANNVRALLLPIVFSLGMLPIFWVGVVYASYEGVFLRMPFLINDQSLHRYTKLALVHAFRTNTRCLHSWLCSAYRMNLNSFDAIDASIEEIRTAWKRE